MGGRCPQRQRDDTDAADQIRVDQNPADTANQTLADSSASAPRQNELLMQTASAPRRNELLIQTASAPRRNEGPESSEFSDQFSDWKFADDSDVSDVQATPVAATPPRTNALRRRRRRTTFTDEYVLEPGDVLGGVPVYFTDYGHRWHLYRDCFHLRRAAAAHTTRTIISRSAPLCNTCKALWAAPRFV